MFWKNINNDLFKPLASINNEIYSISLFALYRHLVVNQTEIGECTPAKAKQVIRNSLLEHGQEVTLREEDEEQCIFDDPDDIARIYRRLKECGWIREVDGLGYRKETFMPSIAASIISALDNISQGPIAKLGSTCQGIYSAIRIVQSTPQSALSNIEFAADCARRFYKELLSMAASCQEIAYTMREEQTGNKLFETFFEDFLKKILLEDYSKLNLTTHPYRYRSVTIREIFDIQQNKPVWLTLVDKHHQEYQTNSQQESEAKLRTELNDIVQILENIDTTLKRIDHYRRTMTKRTREAMQYALTVAPELGEKLDGLIDAVAKLPKDSFIPSNQLTELYIADSRLYQPRTAQAPAEPTRVQKQLPKIEDIARSRAIEAYIKRRAPSPRRILHLIEKALGNKQRVTSDEIEVSNLDDLIAFLQMRELLHDAVPPGSPYSQLTKFYKCKPVQNEYTENTFIIAPKMLIERRVHPSKAKV
ncbi:hypothetical protein TUMSATVNIG1_56900 (plasmid) [Vibrio nigripulchritudo]|uniref:Wadjet anti-phage system protein JetA family protein n=1 Tax=Vibrio nigripulchritudo TaxID=28173 RepID=UPI00190A6E7E|nr:Wadjet anti-phage system protein JetA family protein [Vibrio nigripulchritudo]BCL73707.1 hypothetical protein VNTUMSATTG_56440 [Vibrio nigripulchritudo]BDU35081.1 hypothetical protein TUMSATVNIG1_56900 [Vibrio nigripulchritudo]